MLDYTNITGAASPMLTLAKANGYPVFAKSSGSVESFCKKFGIRFRSLSLFSLLLYASSSKPTLLTVRSKETIICCIVALITGAKVKRVNLNLKTYFIDRFIETVPLEKTGWVEIPEKTMEKAGKTENLPSLVVVSRLKRERKLEVLFKRLGNLRTRIEPTLIGGGDEKIYERISCHVPVKWVRDKMDNFYRTLTSFDLLLYPSAGSDKSCRTVLEAMACGVPVVSMEPLTKRYLTGHEGMLVDLEHIPVLVDRLISLPSLLKKMSLNALKRARRFSVERVRL